MVQAAGFPESPFPIPQPVRRQLHKSIKQLIPITPIRFQYIFFSCFIITLYRMKRYQKHYLIFDTFYTLTLFT